MARVSGPLFSFDASGTIAGAVVFSKWRGRPYVRRHAIPSNPRTALQISLRAMMAFLSRYWQQLSDPDQATWDDPAAAKNYSDFNAFISANMIAWKHGEYPSQLYPREPISTPPGATTNTGAGGVGLLTTTVVPGVPAADWGYAVHVSLTPAFTPTRATLMAILAFDASPLSIVIAPLAPDDYYLGAVAFNVDGVSTVGSTVGPLTVT